MKDYITLPNITDGSLNGQIAQIRRYLYQSVDKLNYVLGMLDGTDGKGGKDEDTRTQEERDRAAFEAVKPFIISSGEIYDRFTNEFVHQYDTVLSYQDVPTGTGSWHWRQWRSGWLEIWYSGSIPSSVLTAAALASGQRVYSANIQFPVGFVFQSPPSVVCSGGSMGIAGRGIGSVRDVYTSQFTFDYYDFADSLLSDITGVSFYISGTYQ